MLPMDMGDAGAGRQDGDPEDAKLAVLEKIRNLMDELDAKGLTDSLKKPEGEADEGEGEADGKPAPVEVEKSVEVGSEKDGGKGPFDKQSKDDSDDGQEEDVSDLAKLRALAAGPRG
jgi:hypothetical protein